VYERERVRRRSPRDKGERSLSTKAETGETGGKTGTRRSSEPCRGNTELPQ